MSGALLAVQSVIFAVWIVVTCGIWLSIVCRALTRGQSLLGPVAQIAVWRSWVSDPATRRARLVWLGLTAFLLLLSAVVAVASAAA